jgi:hypothetical protein
MLSPRGFRTFLSSRCTHSSAIWSSSQVSSRSLTCPSSAADSDKTRPNNRSDRAPGATRISAPETVGRNCLLARPWLRITLSASQEPYDSSQDVHCWHRLHIPFIRVAKLFNEALIFPSGNQVHTHNTQNPQNYDQPMLAKKNDGNVHGQPAQVERMPNDCIDPAVNNGRGTSEILVLFWLAFAAKDNHGEKDENETNGKDCPCNINEPLGNWIMQQEEI